MAFFMEVARALSHFIHFKATVCVPLAAQGHTVMPTLTKRESEILGLIGLNLTCLDIARRLHISIHTVRKHRSHLCEKLDCHSAAQLAVIAASHHRYGGAAAALFQRRSTQLCSREKQVVIAISQGLTSKEIARRIGVPSFRTVQKHRQNAMKKLGVRHLSGLIRISDLLD